MFLAVKMFSNTSRNWRCCNRCSTWDIGWRGRRWRNDKELSVVKSSSIRTSLTLGRYTRSMLLSSRRIRKLRGVSIRLLADTVSTSSRFWLSCSSAFTTMHICRRCIYACLFPPLRDFERARPFPSIMLLAGITNPDSIEFHVVLLSSLLSTLIFAVFFISIFFSLIYLFRSRCIMHVLHRNYTVDAFQRSLEWPNHCVENTRGVYFPWCHTRTEQSIFQIVALL